MIHHYRLLTRQCYPCRYHVRRQWYSVTRVTARLQQAAPPPDDDVVVELDHVFHDSVPGASVAILTLNRPPANAMGKVMLEQFQDALEQIETKVQEPAADENDDDAAPPAPRCVVVTSALAPKVFSAGADLKERKGMTQQQAAEFVTNLRNSMQRLAALPIPVVAAVDGVAVGGGLELALAADLRVATSKTRLGLPETSLAIVPGAGGTQRLPRLIGMARAKELIWTGRRIDGMTAAAYGLVDRVVQEDDNEGDDAKKRTALDEGLELAWEIAKNGPVAIQASKWAMDQGMQAESIEAALEIERKAYARVLPTEDRLEGLAAFKEKRPPEYKGR